MTLFSLYPPGKVTLNIFWVLQLIKFFILLLFLLPTKSCLLKEVFFPHVLLPESTHPFLSPHNRIYTNTLTIPHVICGTVFFFFLNYNWLWSYVKHVEFDCAEEGPGCLFFLQVLEALLLHIHFWKSVLNLCFCGSTLIKASLFACLLFYKIHAPRRQRRCSVCFVSYPRLLSWGPSSCLMFPESIMCLVCLSLAFILLFQSAI